MQLRLHAALLSHRHKVSSYRKQQFVRFSRWRKLTDQQVDSNWLSLCTACLAGSWLFVKFNSKGHIALLVNVKK